MYSTEYESEQVILDWGWDIGSDLKIENKRPIPFPSLLIQLQFCVAFQKHTVV